MRVVHQSATELVLEDSGRGMLLFGGLCLGVAIVAAGFALRDGQWIAALVVLGAFGAAGAVMLRRAESQTHRLDLRQGTLTIASRPALALGATRTSEVTTRPLAEVADVVIEESTPSHAGRTHGYTYRLAYLFADGARRPLLPYYTSGRGGYEALQSTLREALGRAAGDAARRG